MLAAKLSVAKADDPFELRQNRVRMVRQVHQQQRIEFVPMSMKATVRAWHWSTVFQKVAIATGQRRVEL
jgi:hypothetical protein